MGGSFQVAKRAPPILTLLPVTTTGLCATPYPEAKVLTRQQARSDDELSVTKGIRWDVDILDKFVSCSAKFARSGAAGIVSVCAHSVHEDRVRLSPYLACQLMGLDTAQGKLLEEDLAERRHSNHTDAFWENPEFRLQAHIVLFSLLATTKPVAELIADQHNYCFFTEDPPRRDINIAVTDFAVRNITGLTTLDIMRFLSDWRSGTIGMHERELLPFAGVQWDPMEFIVDEGGATTNVNVSQAHVLRLALCEAHSILTLAAFSVSRSLRDMSELTSTRTRRSMTKTTGEGGGTRSTDATYSLVVQQEKPEV